MLKRPQFRKTLALACLSLGSKSTEAPRRLREIIFPAHHLLHQHADAVTSDPVAQPLTVPSEIYDTLRATVVQAELMLLRVLGFELRVPLPLEYLPRYLERATEDLADAGEDYDEWGKEEKEEYGVVRTAMDTGIGRACRAKAVSALVFQDVFRSSGHAVLTDPQLQELSTRKPISRESSRTGMLVLGYEGERLADYWWQERMGRQHIQSQGGCRRF